MKTVAKNDYLELLYGLTRFSSEVAIHARKMHDPRAEFAREMIRSWGMVTARPAAENGMQDIRHLTLLPPEEVVSRACTVTELAFAEFERRGWTLDVPSMEKIRADDRTD
jgi:hypothetical protein